MPEASANAKNEDIVMLNMTECHSGMNGSSSDRSGWVLFTPCIVADLLLKGEADTVTNASAGGLRLAAPACSGSGGFKSVVKLRPSSLPDSKINMWWCVQRPPQHKGEMPETLIGTPGTGKNLNPFLFRGFVRENLEASKSTVPH